MSRHRITTATLLQAIEDRRADEASTRWQELSDEYMSGDDTASTAEVAEVADRPASR